MVVNVITKDQFSAFARVLYVVLLYGTKKIKRGWWYNCTYVLQIDVMRTHSLARMIKEIYRNMLIVRYYNTYGNTSRAFIFDPDCTW